MHLPFRGRSKIGLQPDTIVAPIDVAKANAEDPPVLVKVVSKGFWAQPRIAVSVSLHVQLQEMRRAGDTRVVVTNRLLTLPSQLVFGKL